MRCASDLPKRSVNWIHIITHLDSYKELSLSRRPNLYPTKYKCRTYTAHPLNHYTCPIDLCHPFRKILPLNALPFETQRSQKRTSTRRNSHNKHVPHSRVVCG